MNKTRHNPGSAVIIQLILVMLLSFASSIVSLVSLAGEKPEAGVATDLLLTAVLLLFEATWFGLVCVVGFAVQHKRSRKLALLLIACQAAVIMFAIMSARHPESIVSLLTSVAAVATGLWIIWLSWAVYRSKGGRIVVLSNSRGKQTKS